jgi:hypothetical protein
VIAHIDGPDSPDGTHRGVFRVLKHDAEVAAERCAAPTR